MLMIRLRRMGARNAPYYRVVVSDSRQTPTASAVEEIGHYDPRRNPPEVVLDRARLDHWVSRGARMSPSVAKLARRAAAPPAAARPAKAPAAPVDAAPPAPPAPPAEGAEAT